MNLLDRFSSHLRDCLARSIHLAAELKNPTVEPIHLFFTIAHQKGSVATEIISRFKIPSKTLEEAILRLPIKPDSVSGGLTREHVLTPLSLTTKAALEKAMIIAEQNRHNYIGTEHLLTALVGLKDENIDSIIQSSGVTTLDLKKQLDTVLANASHFPKLNEVNEVVERLEEVGGEGPAPEVMPPLPKNKKGHHKESALEFFATNLTNSEVQKHIDPVIGRDREIERVIHILCRRTKNNPLLLGEPGVGKTAIVEGLAKRILLGQVPDVLLSKKIYALDMGLLIAGTIYRGEFEARLRQVIEEAVRDPHIILFIDELHNIVGAGSNQGTMDAANILKPPLSRGQIRCIGATTPSEYKKYIENDAALERRFQPVIANEPTAEDTVSILEGIKENYENYHHVSISQEAVKAAVDLSLRYITSKFLPDKAIDLLDETAAAKQLSSKSTTHDSKISRLERRLEKIILAKENAAQSDKFDAAVKFKKEEETLRAEIKKMVAHGKTKKVKYVAEVKPTDVAEQVAKIIGTTPAELLRDSTEELVSLEERLQKYVIGQDDVVKEVSRLIRQAKLGLSNPERPLASMLFVGQSGVGKTELAKALANVLYGSEGALIKLDMSEFSEGFAVSKLLGSPAGYVGYKESNQFSDKIKLHPYSVILLDEIDKAHKDIIKLLLQMIENGTITDSAGKKISLRHAIIILTTSFGADIIHKGSLGFGGQLESKNNRSQLIEKLKEFFSPEVINRLDLIALFSPLSQTTLARIAALELQRFNERLLPYHTSVLSDETILKWIVNQLPKQESGAREVRRFLRSHVEHLFSDIILKKHIKKKYTLTVSHDILEVK